MTKKEIQQRFKPIGYKLKEYKQREEYEVLCADNSILILFSADKSNLYEELTKELDRNINGIQTLDMNYLMKDDDIDWLRTGYLPKLISVRKVLQ